MWRTRTFCNAKVPRMLKVLHGSKDANKRHFFFKSAGRDLEWYRLFSNDDKENISFLYSQFMKMKTFYWRKQESRRSFDLTDASLCVLLQILKYTNLCESKVLASVQTAAPGFPLATVSLVTSVNVNVSLTKCATGVLLEVYGAVCDDRLSPVWHTQPHTLSLTHTNLQR